MKRRQLMTIVSLAAGLTVGASNATAHPAKDLSVTPTEKTSMGYLMSGNPRASGGPLSGKGPMGYLMSGNPRAAGGPLNPGHPFEPY